MAWGGARSLVEGGEGSTKAVVEMERRKARTTTMAEGGLKLVMASLLLEGGGGMMLACFRRGVEGGGCVCLSWVGEG